MFKPKPREKGVVLLIVLGTILVVVILASVVLRVVTNQSSLTSHQVNRIKAYYAAKGIMNYAQDMLRQGTWFADANYKHACFRNKGCIDSVSNNFPIDDDVDIKYKIQVTIYPLNQAVNPSLSGVATQLDIKTNYSSL